MFKKNTKHQQPALISAASELPEKQLKMLKASWANSFYDEFFRRIDEEIFAGLYSSKMSRPNVPVNVLVGLEVMKAGFGWSDAEMYENFCFNLQTRYALGYDRLGDGAFAIRTLYYFRERLSKHYLETGVNLLEKVFEQITDAQIKKMQLRTGMQRMDSTQIASSMANISRLQILVEAIRRMHRVLSEADQTRLAESLAPYIRETAAQYTYRVKGKEAVRTKLAETGETLEQLLKELGKEYVGKKAYQVIKRIFAENFEAFASGIRPKENEEMASGSLQSLDDLEASYRVKGKKHYKGYAANITETCDPENELQLITKVQVEPNNVDDSQLLADALPGLQERTKLNTLLTDGGYGGEASDAALEGQPVKLIQTAIRGRKQAPGKLHLSDFEIQLDQREKPIRLTCPHAQTVSIKVTRKQRYHARFDPDICSVCPYHLSGQCRARPQKRDRRYLLSFRMKDVRAARRRKDHQKNKSSGRNLRAAVEATVRSVKHPFRAGKLPVRGKFRMNSMMIASALFVNIRRITRFQANLNLSLFSNRKIRCFGVYRVPAVRVFA